MYELTLEKAQRAYQKVATTNVPSKIKEAMTDLEEIDSILVARRKLAAGT